jgi:hypothetical protein
MIVVNFERLQVGQTTWLFLPQNLFVSSVLLLQRLFGPSIVLSTVQSAHGK